MSLRLYFACLGDVMVREDGTVYQRARIRVQNMLGNPAIDPRNFF